jgi:hypothetical protein
MPTETEMPGRVEAAYRLWLDAAGRNIHEAARILGARRQTLQEWSTRYRWKDRAELEDVEGRDRAVRLAYHRLQQAAASFVDTTILASRCRVVATGLYSGEHYALDDQGFRVDCPTPVAVRAAAAGLQALGLSPATAVALAVEQRATRRRSRCRRPIRGGGDRVPHHVGPRQTAGAAPSRPAPTP